MKLLQSPVIQITLAGAALFVLWHATSAVNQKFSQLPVLQPPSSSAAVPAVDAKEIYPATALRPRPISASSNADVESVFGESPAVAEKEIEVPPPDYSAMFAQSAVLQGVSRDGAYLNGRFYHVGQPMPRLAIARADGSQLVPELVAVRNDSADIKADGAIVTIRVRRGL